MNWEQREGPDSNPSSISPFSEPKSSGWLQDLSALASWQLVWMPSCFGSHSTRHHLCPPALLHVSWQAGIKPLWTFVQALAGTFTSFLAEKWKKPWFVDGQTLWLCVPLHAAVHRGADTVHLALPEQSYPFVRWDVIWVTLRISQVNLAL